MEYIFLGPVDSSILFSSFVVSLFALCIGEFTKRVREMSSQRFVTLYTMAGEPEPGVFGSLESEPLEEKKPGAGAAWKKSHEPEPLKN